MKFIWLILFCWFASCLFAQQPTISYLMCDEAKSQLQIRGTFGTDSGSVTIEDTTLGIISWSDSLIICNLLDSGKGAGGKVVVTTTKGASNKRVLNIFYLQLFCSCEEQGNFWMLLGEDWWNVNWRLDIEPHLSSDISSLSFECSKSSTGKTQYGASGSAFAYPKWSDTSFIKDSSIAVAGTFDLKQQIIKLRIIEMRTGSPESCPGRDITLPMKNLTFDTLGNIKQISDSLFPNSAQRVRYNYSGKIIFPLSPKNDVQRQLESNDLIKIWIDGPFLIIQSSSPLRSITAFLYSIDGRLLKRQILNINTLGSYEFDVSGIHSQFGFLVLQTENGLIARKMILSEP